jgi:hypothetical protein
MRDIPVGDRGRLDVALMFSKSGARLLLLILAEGRGSWLADDLPRSGGDS